MIHPGGEGKELMFFFVYNNSSGARRRKMAVDNTREGQIAAIEITFDRFLKKSERGSSSLSEDEFLSSLKHPTKPDLKAVESIPVYPDFSIWGNAYTLVTFDVDPEMSNDRPAQSHEQGVSNNANNASSSL